MRAPIAVVSLVAALLAAPAVSVARAQDADLLVENVAPAEADYDTDVRFDVTVTNQGPDAANVALSNPIPAGMTFVDAYSDADGAFPCVVQSAGTLACQYAALASESALTLHMIFHIDGYAAGGTAFTSVASVSTTAHDPNASNNVASAVVTIPQPPVADLSAIARVGSQVEIGRGFGDALIFVLGVTNDGPGAAKHAEITCALPPGIEFHVVTGRWQDTNWRCQQNADDSITCWFALVEPGASRGVTLIAPLPAGVTDGTTYAATVHATSDNDPNPDNDSATTSKCVQANYCVAGACNGGVAVVCPQTDDPCIATCDPANGFCLSPPSTECDDGDPCTLAGHCHYGSCVQGLAVECPEPDACHQRGVCVRETGMCSDVPKADESTCAPTQGCTDYRCEAGACAPKLRLWCGSDPPARDAGTRDGELDGSVTEPDRGDGGRPVTPSLADAAVRDAALANTGSGGDDSSKPGFAGGSAHEGTSTDEGAADDAGISGLPHAVACACRVDVGASELPPCTAWGALALLGVALRRRRR